MTNAVISGRFKNAIQVHIVKNFSIKYSDTAPLILAIQGPPGEGKTFQCQKVFEQLNVKVYSLTPGQFESDSAGKPSEDLKKKYLEASQYFMKKREPVVLFINDLDLAIGHMTGDVQTTVNTWLLIGDIMGLADSPTLVDEKNTSRVPLVITGNNFTKLHRPLLRPGRTRLFEWVPSDDEKQAVIQNIFPSLSEKDCIHLLSELRKRLALEHSDLSLPLSFFSSVKNNLLNSYIEEYIDSKGFGAAFDLAIEGSHIDLKIKTDYDVVLETAIQLIESGKAMNYLTA